jgi:hypothetical protein
MHLLRGKFLLFFFSFLILCSQIVSAQDKKTGPLSIADPDIPAPKIESSGITRFPRFTQKNDAGAGAAGEISWPEEERNETFETGRKSEIKAAEYNFRTVNLNERNLDFRGAKLKELKRFPFAGQISPDDRKIEAKDDSEDDAAPEIKKGFNWRGAFNQSMMFLGVQHGYAILGQKKTRTALKGKFWKDYADSVGSLRGWSDGGRFFTNYIAHPMQGSLTGFIYVQNSPQARREQFGMSGKYWRSRMKAMLWTTAWSTQFEIGPISQASIGNVGWNGKQTWEDIVTTPTIGTAMLVIEDAVDRFLIKNIERRTNNFYIKIFSRMIFNPTRIFANLLRFKEPWYRDRPTAR